MVIIAPVLAVLTDNLNARDFCAGAEIVRVRVGCAAPDPAGVHVWCGFHGLGQLGEHVTAAVVKAVTCL